MKKYKNKILLTLFFAIALVFLNNNVFATDNDVNNKFASLEEITAVYPSIFDGIKNTPEYISGNYYMLFGASDTSYARVYFIEKVDGLKLYDRGDGMYTYRIFSNINVPTIYYRVNSNGVCGGRTELTSLDFTVYYSISANRINGKPVFFSEYDVYTNNSYSTLFFQAPPPIVEEETTPFQEAMRQVEMKLTLAEVVAILPVILSVLVSLIALRKGFLVLSTFLRKS